MSEIVPLKSNTLCSCSIAENDRLFIPLISEYCNILLLHAIEQNDFRLHQMHEMQTIVPDDRVVCLSVWPLVCLSVIYFVFTYAYF